MARIRTVKPDLFRHEALFEAEQETSLPLRLVFIGLFCCCDREGRFEWRPRKLKLDVLPYDDIEFSRVLDALATRGFIVKYEVSGVDYGCIPSFSRHQVINNRERASEYPDIAAGNVLLAGDSFGYGELTERESRVLDASVTREGNAQEEGKGKEGKGKGNTAAQIAKNAIGLPLMNNGFFAIKPEQLEKLKTLYPDIDCEQELRNMIGWFDANPEKLKPRTAIQSFLNSWLANRQTDYHNSNRADDLDLDDTSWAEGLMLQGSAQ